MKEHFLTLFLAITTGITILIVTLVNAYPAVAVFDFSDILFNHQTAHGNLVVTASAYDELMLSFLTHNLGGSVKMGSAYASPYNEKTALAILPANQDIPLTTYAIITTEPALQQVIVLEAGFKIAHHARAKRTTDEALAVLMISSVDLTGHDSLIIGLDADDAVLFEIEIP